MQNIQVDDEREADFSDQVDNQLLSLTYEQVLVDGGGGMDAVTGKFLTPTAGTYR